LDNGDDRQKDIEQDLMQYIHGLMDKYDLTFAEVINVGLGDIFGCDPDPEVYEKIMNGGKD